MQGSSSQSNDTTQIGLEASAPPNSTLRASNIPHSSLRDAETSPYISGLPPLSNIPEGGAFRALFDAYQKCSHSLCPTPSWLSNDAQEDGFVGRKALQLLRRRPKTMPFFLQVSPGSNLHIQYVYKRPSFRFIHE